jgi:hypothetical protein
MSHDTHDDAQDIPSLDRRHTDRIDLALAPYGPSLACGAMMPDDDLDALCIQVIASLSKPREDKTRSTRRN